MALPRPVTFDLDNFHRLEWYTASRHLNNLLAQKGFCFVEGSLEKADAELVEHEAATLKAAGKLKRTPKEAADCLFGEVVSAWTYTLQHQDADEASLPEGESGMRSVDKFLDQVGYCIAAGSQSFLGRAVRGREPGVLHQSRLAEDDDPPELLDPEEACSYGTLCSTRKVVLLYYLGPSTAVASFLPRDAAASAYEVRIREHTVIAYLNDACTLLLQELGPGCLYEVNLILQGKVSLQQAPKDVLGIPRSLHEWFEERLQRIRSEPEEISRTYPFHYVKQANLLYLRGEPVKVVAAHQELPSLPRGDNITTPLEGCILGGLDTAAPIKTPPPVGTSTRTGLNSLEYYGAKWDLSEYFSEEGDVDNFKMYTKHLNVLHRSYDIAFDFDYASFGLTKEENAALDQRGRMLCEAHGQLLRQVQESRPRPRPWGVYAGLSGQQQDWHFLAGEAKINRHTWQSSSNAALVSRSSYALNFKGPVVAIDTEDSSGLIAADAAARAVREGVCSSALASSAAFISHPYELLKLCAAGFVSPSGRSKVFDASCDGFSRGEGVVSLLLKMSDTDNEKELRDVGARAIIAGSGVNNKGQSSSLGSPSGPAIMDVISRAARDAQLPAFAFDGVEASAAGELLADQIEIKVLQHKLQHEDKSAQAVCISSSKAGFGHLGAPSGLVGVARSLFILDHGVAGPQIHLRELVDAQLEEELTWRGIFPTEVLEARGFAQILGISSFGRTGSSCHQILMGERPEPSRQPEPARAVRWWPGEDKKESQATSVLRGYFLMGTMTAWTEGLRMEKESEGVYGYTLALGDNNWERFQIWIDEDPDKVLHPCAPDHTRESVVEGPESSVSQMLSWKIIGHKQEAYLVNEEQWEKLAVEDMKTMREAVQTGRLQYVVAFGGNYVPPGHEGGISNMPLVNLNADLDGHPGDLYRIRLHIQGKYKRVEWSRARGADAVAPLGRRPFPNHYAIIGDHSYWQFEHMEEKEKGVYTAEVQILKSPSNFQIYRNRDFLQGFHPSTDTEDDITGPSAYNQGLHWKLSGQVGDIFKVTFRRSVRRDEDKRSISWEKTGSREVDFEELAKSHQYFLVGSWNAFEHAREMKKVDQDGKVVFQQEVTVGQSGTEAFQILLNRNWLAAVHPDKNEAIQSDGHRLLGPDDEGAEKYWAIGADPSDDLSAGSHAMIYLELSKGLPHRVWWQKFDSPNIHHEYLKAGSQRVFERHLRLMGLIPWSKGKPARLANPPEWYGSGRDREDLEYKNLFVITQDMANPNYKKETEALEE